MVTPSMVKVCMVQRVVTTFVILIQRRWSCVDDYHSPNGIFEDDHDVRKYTAQTSVAISRLDRIVTATVDEHLQKVGAEEFTKFQRYAVSIGVVS